MTQAGSTRPRGLLGAAEIRRLAADLDLRPTKTLGQNFVHDANTVRRIVAAADLGPTEHVLEVGPGLGSLTLALLEAGHPVTAVEIDPRLADRLPATVAEHLGQVPLTVLTADALHLRAEQVGEPTALVANLPYNVAVPVLLDLLAEVQTLRSALVLVQAEVADRLAAAPGSKVYGSPSVKAAWYGPSRRAGAVSRAVFWPVPGVDSALVALRRGPDRDADREAVFAVVDAAFAQRRKTLRAALAGWAGSADAAERVLRAAGVDPSARGETLDVDAFIAIAAAHEAANAEAVNESDEARTVAATDAATAAAAARETMAAIDAATAAAAARATVAATGAATGAAQ